MTVESNRFFCSDTKLLKIYQTLVGLLSDLGKSVLHTEDAKAMAMQLGDAGIRARYCTNLAIVATKLMKCCEDIDANVKKLNTQCEHADSAARQELSYTPSHSWNRHKYYKSQ